MINTKSTREPVMDHRDEFSKWMQAVEEALSDEKKGIAESMPEAGSECGCGKWDCPECFPEQDQAPGGATPVVIAATGCPACGSQKEPQVCPVCGQPHANQDGQMSPMSIPPMGHGEIETEVEMEPEFDGELDELSEPTVTNYRDKAIDQHRDLSGLGGSRNSNDQFALDNRDSGIVRANNRLGNEFDNFDKSDEFAVNPDDQFREPDNEFDDFGPYGGRNDDFQSNLTARGFEEDAPEEPEVDRTPSNGKPGVKLGHITQKFEPLGGADEDGEDSPLTYGEDNLDENDYDDREPSHDELSDIENSTDPSVNPAHANQDIDAIMYMQSCGLSMSDTHYDEKELYTLTPEQLQQVKAEVMGGQQAPMEEDDMMADPSAGGNVPAATMPTGGTAGGGQPSSGGGAGNYAPGTAPTMPESIQQGKRTMENIDSDIARIMKGFSQYDELKASKAIVAEKKGGKPEWLEDKEKEAEKKEGKKVDEDKESGNPWAKGGSKSEEDKKETKTSKGGTVTKTETGLKHKGTYGDGKKEVKESEGADAETLAWMARFAKLGNMKGYGR